VDAAAKSEVEWLIALTGAVRAAKNELGINPGAKLGAYCPAPSADTKAIIERNQSVLDRVARIDAVHFKPAGDGPAMQIGVGADTFTIPLDGVVDLDAEKARLSKALEAARKETKSLEGRLGNANFLERAKPEAVEKAKADHAMHSAEAERLAAALERLG